MIMDTLRLYIVTWNVATGFPDENFTELLDIKRFQNEDNLPDFYIIGLQEVKSQPQNFVMDALFSDPWTSAFKTALAPYDYVKVKSIRLVGLLLNIFCLRKHVIHLRDIYTENTKTGLLGLWGNKGAVTVRLQIYGCSMCLVNCHLAPHDNAVRERIDDYNTILKGQKFATKETTSILFHDYVYWFGDLNFRIANDATLSANEIINKVEANQISWLLNQDQLKRVIKTGEAFSELVEGELTFRPTYKYFVGSQEYDPKRRPAWTDRILYRVNKFAYENITLDVKQLSYKSYDRCSASDHKPVVSELLMKVFSNYSERLVEIEIVDDWKCDVENKAIITLESNTAPTLWDWIGIYKENFTDLDEYLHYIYVTLSRNDSPRSSHSEDTQGEVRTTVSPLPTNQSDPANRYMVTFPDTAIKSPGQYRLLYFTRDSNSILGMSPRLTVSGDNYTRVPLDW